MAKQDFISIFPWMNTPLGYSYVPAAILTDNVKAVDFWKRFVMGTPAEQNIKVVKKGTMQVHTRANTIFVAWPKEITFLDQYVIPPACLMVEGQGKLKTLAYSISVASGYRMKTEGNIFADAFVTFFHPKSKYSGPGTDGVLGRDVIMEFSPPT